MAKILAIAMTGETLTNKYEVAIASTSELIRMPESMKREYRSSKLFQWLESRIKKGGGVIFCKV